MESKCDRVSVRMISKFSGKECQAAVYFAEMMCMRKAKKEKKHLPNNFWNSPVWAEHYKGQIVAANNLLKYFPAELIDAALQTKECNWSYSLRYQGIIPSIKRLQAEVTVQKAKEERVIIVDENNVNVIPSAPKKKTTKSKLEEFE